MVNKSELMNRLKSAGLWNQANAEKNELIKQYRSEGLIRPEASDRAWHDIAAKYPQAELASVEAVFDDQADFVPSVLWVFDNLGRKVNEQDAPGAGAWVLLQWARENSSDFFKSVLPKALDLQARQGGAMDEQAEEELEAGEELGLMLKGMMDGGTGFPAVEGVADYAHARVESTDSPPT